MARVWIPPLLRDLTGDHETVTVPGSRVRGIIDELDQLYPGMRDRLCQGDDLRPGIAVVVDTQLARLGLSEPVGVESEVHFLPAIAGGQEPASKHKRIFRKRGATLADRSATPLYLSAHGRDTP
jgi:molybdopterin converting factor small subunit